MDAAQLLIKEEDIIKIILEFLSSKHYHVTLRTLEKESNIFNCDYSDEVFFLRELVLDGDFNEVIDFGKSFASSRDFNQNLFNYTVLRQKFIELIYMKFHLINPNTTNNEGKVEDVMKTLRDLESCCPNKEEYTNLCWLLTVPDLNAQEGFKNWRVDVSRLKCFEELLNCLSNLMPLVKKRKGNTKIAGKDRLLQLLVKGLFYESCIDYCQSVASATDKKPEISLKNEVLDSTVDSIPSNLLSWINCLPLEVFSMPFEHTNVDVCVSNVVTKQIISLSNPNKTDFNQSFLQQDFANEIKEFNNVSPKKMIPQQKIVPDEKNRKILENIDFQKAESLKLNSDIDLELKDNTNARKKIQYNNNDNNKKPTKNERPNLSKNEKHTFNKKDKLIKNAANNIEYSAVNSLEDQHIKNQQQVDKKKSDTKIDSQNLSPPYKDVTKEFNIIPLNKLSKFNNLTSSVEQLRSSYTTNQTKIIDSSPEEEAIEIVTDEFHSAQQSPIDQLGAVENLDEKQANTDINGGINHVVNTEVAGKNIPAPIRLDFNFEGNDDIDPMKTPTLTKFQEKKKNELFNSNTSTPKPSKKGTPKPEVPNASPVKKSTTTLSDKFENGGSVEEQNHNDYVDKENAYNEEEVVLGPVINGVRRPISAGYLNSSHPFEERQEIADFKSKKLSKPSKVQKSKPESTKNDREPMKTRIDTVANTKTNIRSSDIPSLITNSLTNDSNNAVPSQDTIWKYSPMAMIEDAQAVRSVAFNPNGSLYAIGANSKILRICKVDDVEANDSDQGLPSMSVMFKRAKYHRGSIYCMGWSPDGELLATGSNDKSIKLLKFDGRLFNQVGEEIELNIHNGTVRELSFVPNRCGLLVSGGAGDGCVHVSDVISQKLSGTFDGHSGNVLTVYAGDGDIVATGGTDNTVRLWDLRSQRCIDVVVVGDSSPASVTLSGSDKYLASGQEDGSILLYDLVAGRTLQNFRLHQSDCRSVRFSPDSSRLLTASYDTTISLLHLNKDLEITIPNHYVIGKHNDKVIQTRWHPTDEYILSSSADRTAVLWKSDM